MRRALILVGVLVVAGVGAGLLWWALRGTGTPQTAPPEPTAPGTSTSATASATTAAPPSPAPSSPTVAPPASAPSATDPEAADPSDGAGAPAAYDPALTRRHPDTTRAAALLDVATVARVLDLERTSDINRDQFTPEPFLGIDPERCTFDKPLGEAAETQGVGYYYPLTDDGTGQPRSLQARVALFTFASPEQAQQAVTTMAQTIADCDEERITAWSCENCDGIATFTLQASAPAGSASAPRADHVELDATNIGTWSTRVAAVAVGQTVVVTATVRSVVPDLEGNAPDHVDAPSVAGLGRLTDAVIDRLTG